MFWNEICLTFWKGQYVHAFNHLVTNESQTSVKVDFIQFMF